MSLILRSLAFGSIAALAALLATPWMDAAAQVTPRTRGLAIVASEEKRSEIVEIVTSVATTGDAGDVKSDDPAIVKARQEAFDKVRGMLPADGPLAVRADRGLDDARIVSIDPVIGPDGKTAYRVLIEVMVYPNRIPTPAAPPSPEDPLTVQIRADRHDYAEGDEIVVLLKGNKDFYGRVTYTDAKGEVVQVLPNDYRANAQFSANTEYRLPDLGDRFKLKVTPPFGVEKFTLYASTSPLGDVQLKASGDGSGLRTGRSEEEVAVATRGLKVVGVDKPLPYVVTTWQVNTLPREAYDRIESLNRDLDQMRKGITQIEAEMAALSAAALSLRKEADAAREAAKAARDKAAVAKGQLLQSQFETAAAKERAAQAEQAAADAETKAAAAEQRATEAEKKAADALKSAADAEERAKAKEEEAAELRGQLITSQVQTAVTKGQLQDTQNKAQAQVQEAEKKAQEAEERAKAAKAESDAARAAAEEANKRAEQAQKETTAAKQETQQAKEEKEDASLQARVATARANDAAQRVVEIAREAAIAKARFNELQWRLSRKDQLDVRLPQACTPQVGVSMLPELNRMKPVGGVETDIVAIEGMATKAMGDAGLTCVAVLVANGGQKYPVEITVSISSIGHVFLKVN
jgi:hypothetical protein